MSRIPTDRWTDRSSTGEQDSWLNDGQVSLPRSGTGLTQPFDGRFAYPLSFLMLLTTMAAVFFAVWNLSPSVALFSAAFMAPVMMRVVWVFERARGEGRNLTLSQQCSLLASATLGVATGSLIFAFVAAACFALTVSGFMMFGTLFLGPEGDSEGTVLGVVVALPVAAAASAFATAGFIRYLWSEASPAAKDMRN